MKILGWCLIALVVLSAGGFVLYKQIVKSLKTSTPLPAPTPAILVAPVDSLEDRAYFSDNGTPPISSFVATPVVPPQNTVSNSYFGVTSDQPVVQNSDGSTFIGGSGGGVLIGVASYTPLT